jgi:hypothetical protein
MLGMFGLFGGSSRCHQFLRREVAPEEKMKMKVAVCTEQVSPLLWATTASYITMRSCGTLSGRRARRAPEAALDCRVQPINSGM